MDKERISANVKRLSAFYTYAFYSTKTIGHSDKMNDGTPARRALPGKFIVVGEGKMKAKPNDRSDNVERIQKNINHTIENMRKADEMVIAR